MENLFSSIKKRVEKHRPKIVFPEALDERILSAASKLGQEEVLIPILIGEERQIIEKADSLSLSLQNIEIIDPKKFPHFDQLVHSLVAVRKGKETEESAKEKLMDENYFGTMLVYDDFAQGLVSGAAHSTGDTVRPALQIIKTKEGVQKTSGVFVMVKGDSRFVFADCAINIAPTAEELAEIAICTAETAKLLFDIEPKVAMLSFSTKGSASSIETQKVAKATKIAQTARPDLIIDGEFQFDAAFVPAIAKKKAPDSPLKGEANVFIFPSLESGNLGYKIAQRLGGYEAIGPVLQGLRKPVNDLSRGCSSDDVYKLALITGLQAMNQKASVKS